MKYEKILIIGTSGSGKTTLAKQISAALEIPFHATDPFYWGDDWAEVLHAIVHDRISAVVAQPAWVMDGNFDNERELVWENADCIVWLDYPFLLVLFRVVTRNLGWWLSHRQIWSGNRMTWSRLVSGVRHSIRSYPKKKHQYSEWLEDDALREVRRFRNSRETRRWLKAITSDRLSERHQE